MPKTLIIPMRPENHKTQLTQGEQNCLTWYVLSGCAKEEAFFLFARPDMADSKAKAVVKETIKQFFARADVKEYLFAYRETLGCFANPKRREEASEEVVATTVEERKAKAMSKLVDYILSEAENIKTADEPKSIIDYASKIGLFDESEKVAEQPRRYLPVSCSGCAYRKFVEENCEVVPDGTELA